MNALEMIAAAHALPKTLRVVTLYADGRERHHDVRSPGAAENWAIGERRQIGRDLTDRETGMTVRVVAVHIRPIAA